MSITNHRKKSFVRDKDVCSWLGLNPAELILMGDNWFLFPSQLKSKTLKSSQSFIYEPCTVKYLLESLLLHVVNH
jgi:hypothetical protein